MKINEVTQPSSKTVFESIDAENNSKFLTEDLVGIVNAHHDDQWTSYDANDYIQSLREGKLPWMAK